MSSAASAPVACKARCQSGAGRPWSCATGSAHSGAVLHRAKLMLLPLRRPVSAALGFALRSACCGVKTPCGLHSLTTCRALIQDNGLDVSQLQQYMLPFIFLVHTGFTPLSSSQRKVSTAAAQIPSPCLRLRNYTYGCRYSDLHGGICARQHHKAALTWTSLGPAAHNSSHNSSYSC